MNDTKRDNTIQYIILSVASLSLIVSIFGLVVSLNRPAASDNPPTLNANPGSNGSSELPPGGGTQSEGLHIDGPETVQQ